MSGLAIVTGGGTGIGRHLVEALCSAGYSVCFTYRGDGRASNALMQQLTEAGARVKSFACDAGIKSEVDLFFAECMAWHGAAPAVLINNAGTQTWSSLLDLSEKDWDEVIQSNLKGCFLNTQAAARLMAERGPGGAIINIGSGCNKLAFPRLVDYTASKGGIEQFTKAAAVELGAYGITVNCVAPGAIITDRTLREAPDYARHWSSITPLGRVGTPADVAGAVLFFTSTAARFVTGQTLWVDGGVFTRASWPHAIGDRR